MAGGVILLLFYKMIKKSFPQRFWRMRFGVFFGKQGNDIWCVYR